MDSERGGMFSRHFVKDREMRNVLTDTFKISTSRYARKSKYITDKDILIIDDTIGSGQSIKNACQVMMESYAPKSVTVLTLLSKLH
jgi:hypoxanthine-guanine phosphoribosyltransferase